MGTWPWAPSQMTDTHVALVLGCEAKMNERMAEARVAKQESAEATARNLKYVAKPGTV